MRRSPWYRTTRAPLETRGSERGRVLSESANESEEWACEDGEELIAQNYYCYELEEEGLTEKYASRTKRVNKGLEIYRSLERREREFIRDIIAEFYES